MPTNELAAVLSGLNDSARTGHDLSAASAATIAPLLRVDAVTLSMLSASGSLELLWADPANQLGAAVDDLQYTLGEGPTPEAAHTGHTVSASDLTASYERWPVLAPAAHDTAVRGIIAAPLRLGAAVVGVLTGCRREPGSFPPEQVGDVHAFARVALDLLLQTPTATLTQPPSPDPVLDLHRAEVHQAAGMLTLQLGVTIDQALLHLRLHAWTHNRPLRDVARRLRLDRP
ncbi:GAF and ANTAR domain-containing protein [Streptomyces sp. ODS28]|uniref:GAF and ANTAR domain-containing protein n=1 Tax=Streptomyces sp. ODS28 TaxID=3136688 RepID=UPI0031E7D861